MITAILLHLTLALAPAAAAGHEAGRVSAPAAAPPASAVASVARSDHLAPEPAVGRRAVLPSRRPAVRRVDLVVNASAPTDTTRPRKVVIIDAGHGGRDPGRDGPGGLLEKNVTLTLARKLAAELEDRGYEVHLTRDRDTLIALADRPRRANDWKRGRPRSIFISIHANAGVGQAAGFETFFLSDARTADERRVAEMENGAEAYEDGSAKAAPDVDRILNSLRNDYYVRASDDLAELVQSRLADVHPGPNRGVKQAGFRVLVGAIMPAVLVETAFISNRKEARLLGSASFQRKLVQALADAIGDFFSRHAWAAGEDD